MALVLAKHVELKTAISIRKFIDESKKIVDGEILNLITNKIQPMRVSAEEEELGLDITQHGESYQTLSIDL